MALAFVHLIGAWLFTKGYEFLSRTKINKEMWFCLLLGAILPDIDYLIDWTLGTGIHRTFTHSLWVVIAVLFAYLVFKILKDQKKESYTAALGLGIVIHLLIDFFSAQGIPLLWPSGIYFSIKGLGVYNPAISLLKGSPTFLFKKLKLAIFDMGLGTVWIFYLWLRGRVKF